MHIKEKYALLTLNPRQLICL